MARDDEFDDPRRDYDEQFDRPLRKKKSGTGLIIGLLVGAFVLCCGGGGAAIYFFVRGVKKGVAQVQEAVQEAQDMQQSQNNLRQIGVAAHEYEANGGSFPNNSYAADGKQSRPLLSWRVHLLPYVNQQALYNQFKLDEPWDSPNNKPLLDRMPEVYATQEARKRAGAGRTYYRGFSHPGAIFEKPQAPGAPVPKISIPMVTDGVSNTVLVVEAGEPVEWTKPDDIDWSPGRPRPALGYSGQIRPTFLALMADGQVKQLRKDLPDETLRLLITRNDGQKIPLGWDNP